MPSPAPITASSIANIISIVKKQQGGSKFFILYSSLFTFFRTFVPNLESSLEDFEQLSFISH